MTAEAPKIPSTAPRSCTVPGCGKRHKARGWCDTHYRRFLWRGGDPAQRQKPGPRPNR